MIAEPIFFRDLAYVFLAALFGGGLAWLLKQPLIVGYVVGGILISPFTPGPSVSDVKTFEVFAEIGVVLLMFSIGLEFSLADLLRVKWVALVGGPLGILLSIGLSLMIGSFLGWSSITAVVVGAVISVASTMVLARLLIDRGELHSRHGRVMIGITLVEDLAVVVLTVLLPSLGPIEPGRFFQIGMAVTKSAVILAPFIYLASKVVPPLLTRIARTQNQELFLIVALALGIGTAALTQAVGLSLALGAFLAGLIISGSDYAHETFARMLSLRDAFVALFFVTIGALIDPSTVFSNWPLLITMIGLVVLGKSIIWTAVVSLFGYPLGTAFLVALGLTQIGEFSFVLVEVSRSAGLVGNEVYNATLAASLVTILLNTQLLRYVPNWIHLGRHTPERLANTGIHVPQASRHVIICGFGRVGSAVGEALNTFGISFVAIERDPDIVIALRRRGMPCLFGDAAHRQLLSEAGAERAALAIVALPGIDSARLAVQYLRAINPTLVILARAHGRLEAEDLRKMGATEVIQPELEASATLIRHALHRMALSKEAAISYLERFRDAIEEVRKRPEDGGLPEVRELYTPALLKDLSLRQLRLRERFGVTVVGIIRSNGDTILDPSADTVLRAGDRIRFFGLPKQLDEFPGRLQELL
jgi:CPA2 family monovalent cation:H+ antiporter-2